MAGVITASEPSLTTPFSGIGPRQFSKLVTALRREGAEPARKGRPWSLPLEDRVLLVAAYWRTNLTLRQLAPLFGVSKSAADRIIDHLGPLLTLQQRKRFRKDTVLIVDGTLVPTRDHSIAEQSKNYRYSTNHQVVIDADTRLVVAASRPLPRRPPRRCSSTPQRRRSGPRRSRRRSERALPPRRRARSSTRRKPERGLAWAGVPRRIGWENRCRANGSRW